MSWKCLFGLQTILLLVLLIVCGWIAFRYVELKTRLGLANGQTEIFEDMRQQALGAETSKAASCLRYTVNYYPPGTKQVPGTTLNRIVERQRAVVVADIIAHLRAKSGRDLGNDPEAWIQAYSTTP